MSLAAGLCASASSKGSENGDDDHARERQQLDDCRTQHCPCVMRDKPACRRRLAAVGKPETSETIFPKGRNAGKDAKANGRRAVLLGTVCLQTLILFGALGFLAFKMTSEENDKPRQFAGIETPDNARIAETDRRPSLPAPPPRPVVAPPMPATAGLYTPPRPTPAVPSTAEVTPFPGSIFDSVPAAPVTPTPAVRTPPAAPLRSAFVTQTPPVRPEPRSHPVAMRSGAVVSTPSVTPPATVTGDRSGEPTLLREPMPIHTSPQTPTEPGPTAETAPPKPSPKELFEEAVRLLAEKPDESLALSLRAVEILLAEKSGLPFFTYSLIGQAYASQNWGKSLLANVAAVEDMSVGTSGRWLLARHADGKIRIWDLTSTNGQDAAITLDAGPVPLVKVLFSTDERNVIAGYEDGTVAYWSLDEPGSMPWKKTLTGGIAGLRDLRISPDGRWLAAFGSPTPDGRCELPLGCDGPLPVVAGPMPDGRIAPHAPVARSPQPLDLSRPLEAALEAAMPGLLPMSGEINRVRPLLSTAIRDARYREGVELGEIRLASHQPPLAGSETPDAASLTRHGVLATQPNIDPHAVWLWDLQELQTRGKTDPVLLHGHQRPLQLLRISDDSRYLASGSQDGTVRVYDLRGGIAEIQAYVLRGHILDITALAFSSRGHWVVTGSRDNTVRLWKLDASQPGPETLVLGEHLGWVSDLTFDDEERILISASYDKTLRVWDFPDCLRNGVSRASYQALTDNRGVSRKLLTGRGGNVFVSLDFNGHLRVFSGEAGFRRNSSTFFGNRTLPITNIAVTPDRKWLIFSYCNQNDPAQSGVRLWPLDLDELLGIAGGR